MSVRGLSPPKSAWRMAPPSVRLLMRWAAHSAPISEQGRPHTFSVYDLKNMRKSRGPNRLIIHCSRVFSSGRGNTFLRA